MGKRLKTGLIGGAYLAVATYTGGYLFKFTFFIITMVALFEYDKAVNKNGSHIFKFNYLMTIVIFGSNVVGININAYLILSLYMIIVGIFYVISSNTKLFDITATTFGLLYIVILMYHVILQCDSIYIWVSYAVSFSADSFAYLAGSRFGKHKLCAKLSPKKTIEGAIGGLVGTVFIMLVLNIFMLKSNIRPVLLIASIGFVVSVFGDLVASKIKREYNVKDYGNILPGHGGILDRFDSFLLVAPTVYYMTLFLL